MHPESLALMEALLKNAPSDTHRVLDVGSLDVNGSFRPLVEGRGWDYVGIDIREGRNVDQVVPPYNFPFEDDTFDVIISGSTMEHVERPWLWIPELVRVLRSGGLLAIATVHVWGEHRHPVDCWRFLPDGMKVLFDDTKLLEEYDIRMVTNRDIGAMAFKKVAA